MLILGGYSGIFMNHSLEQLVQTVKALVHQGRSVQQALAEVKARYGLSAEDVKQIRELLIRDEAWWIDAKKKEAADFTIACVGEEQNGSPLNLGNKEPPSDVYELAEELESVTFDDPVASSHPKKKKDSAEDIDFDDLVAEEEAAPSAKRGCLKAKAKARDEEPEEIGADLFADDGSSEFRWDDGAAAVTEDEALAGPVRAVFCMPRRGGTGLRKPRRHSSLKRRATVRYYQRMNPMKTYPFLVVISEQHLREITQANVGQKPGQAFRVQEGAKVEVEPILPGCTCYPPREEVTVGSKTVKVKFWVMPQMLGILKGPRLVIRHEGKILSQIPLEIKVVKQTLTVILGLLTLTLPFLSVILEHNELDFKTQVKGDFELYATLGRLVVEAIQGLGSLTPEVFGLALLALTIVCYFWKKPRRKEVFWNIKTITPEEIFQEALLEMDRDPEQGIERIYSLLDANPEFQPGWFFYAEWHAAQDCHQEALDYYEQGLALGPAAAKDYLKAALAAGKLGQFKRAYELLEVARQHHPESSSLGIICYNMACYAARQGQLFLAVQCLQQALAAGYDNRQKIMTDPDLQLLRMRADFQGIMLQVS